MNIIIFDKRVAGWRSSAGGDINTVKISDMVGEEVGWSTSGCIVRRRDFQGNLATWSFVTLNG